MDEEDDAGGGEEDDLPGVGEEVNVDPPGVGVEAGGFEISEEVEEGEEAEGDGESAGEGEGRLEGFGASHAGPLARENELGRTRGGER